MEREYFARERPSRPDQALTGLVEWLNWYNLERPHSALNYEAPFSRYLEPPLLLTVEALTHYVQPPDDLPCIGFVEAIRMVEEKGKVLLWQKSDPIFLCLRPA